MKHLTRFSTTVRNNLVGLAVLAALWILLAAGFPDYIFPSPWTVLRAAPAYLSPAFPNHLALTAYRAGVGFVIAFLGGSALGIAAFLLRLTAHLTSVMVALQVIPGIILGVIFLLLLGIGNHVPIALVAALTLPTVAINTATGLNKRSVALEEYLLSVGGGRGHLIRYLYMPTLIPTFQSNLSLGFGLSLKVVILGEFIGTQDGLGYLLNVAALRFNMSAVLFYLCVALLATTVFEIGQSLLFATLWGKYFYSE